MDPLWRIEMFGGLRAVSGDHVVSRFRSQKTGALLASSPSTRSAPIPATC